MSTAPRQQLVQTLFPSGIPNLWCPPLTHFLASGDLDRERITAHLRHLGRHARGWLIPGSTGEGWQMDDQAVRNVLEHALTVAPQVGARVLVGVLRQDTQSAIECIQETAEWLIRRGQSRDPVECLVQQHVCGFTVCPPTGADLSDDVLHESLRDVLKLAYPTAIYQLPQITENEMPPALVADLAAEYQNFYLFKDTSGSDRVAMSDVDLRDVFLVRGAEGQYARWLKDAGGPYDGFLLSTANVFAEQLDQMIRCVQNHDSPAGAQAIAALEQVVTDVFQRVGALSYGNAFTNANKAIDHFQAHGTDADNHAAPYLIDGQQLPADVLTATRKTLQQAGLLPDRGYLSPQ